MITCYLDDSDSEEFGFIGGIVVTKDQYDKLNEAWNIVLRKYRLECIHMNDFVRPQGRYVGMHYELKLSLFKDIARTIRNNRIWSLSLGVDLRTFEGIVPSVATKKFIRPYTFAFYFAVELNSAMCLRHQYHGRVAYLVDHGKFEHQLMEAHKSALKWERVAGIPRYIGPMAFDSDTNNNALQAADVVVWAARRKRHGGLSDEFKPLEQILENQIGLSGRVSSPHFDNVIPTEGVNKLAKDLSWWTAKRGRMPLALEEIIPDTNPTL
ncbi:MAG TPA: DUF3800 domain-containing protein [Bryobacteraceae bacterium]|nr:DUF3800 domain-containing protein [Bryobacteraceae bacterium]